MYFTNTTDDDTIAAVVWELWITSRFVIQEFGLSRTEVLGALFNDQLDPQHYPRNAYLFGTIIFYIYVTCNYEGRMVLSLNCNLCR